MSYFGSKIEKTKYHGNIRTHIRDTHTETNTQTTTKIDMVNTSTCLDSASQLRSPQLP